MTLVSDDQHVQRLIESVFQNHAPEQKATILKAIAQKSGLAVESLTYDNYERFLEAMNVELCATIGDWKARFVTQVVRIILQKQLKNLKAS
jgi:hypothetical protein